MSARPPLGIGDLRIVEQHQPRPLDVFCSHAADDAALYEELDKHLRFLQRLDMATFWHAGIIMAGTETLREARRRLDESNVILLLVSANYIASDYCYQEILRALERHRAKEARVIPIILRPCVWSELPFASLELLPHGRKAVTAWADRDEAWTDVALGIHRAIAEAPFLAAPV